MVTPSVAAVHEKTDGNPFYVGQFLRALEHDGLLAFDPGADGWTWDVARIRTAETTANVVDLMVAKIRRLPTGTQTVLQLSACIGNRFDLDTLGIVSETSAADAGRRLWPAVREGLVLPVGEAYRDIPDEDHAWADCGGTPDSHRWNDGPVDALAHTFVDPGGIVHAGLPAWAESREYEQAEQDGTLQDTIPACFEEEAS